MVRNSGRGTSPQWYDKSAELKNLKAMPSSMNPSTTFSTFSQPPERGSDFSQVGNRANTINGRAKASENESMPSVGRSSSPLAAAMATEPTMGTVHENDTRTSVVAMKNRPVQPPLSAWASALFTNALGALISNSPRNDRPKMIKMANDSRLGSQLELMKLAASAPKSRLSSTPALV